MALLAGLAPATFASVGVTRYVATTGSDASNDCTVVAAACLTIQHAIDEASAGDSIYVYPGAYDETASGRGTDTDTGPYQFGLFFPPSKPGLLLQGVTAGGAPITSAAGVLTTVTTNATNSFGYAGVFVSADSITVRGMGFGENDPWSDAKTFEVIGDGFTLDASVIDSSASVYIADWATRYNENSTPGNFADDTSHIQTYTVTGNVFDGDSSLYIANGAGASGAASGRVITGNAFTTFQPVSFAGPGSAGWLLYPVGGAVFTGNVFTDGTATRYVQAWGTYQLTGQFDWSDIFSLNTYPHAVVTTTDGNLDNLRPYTAGAFVDIYRVGAVIQNRVDNAQPGDTVIAGPGLFAENVDINKAISVVGAGSGSNPLADTIIDPTGGTTGLYIHQPVNLDGLRVTGTGYGIRVEKSSPARLGFADVTWNDIFVTANTSRGVEIHNGTDISDMAITNSSFSANSNIGFRSASDVTQTDMTITDSHFDLDTYGLYLQGTISGLDISGSSFDDNSIWGMYMSETGAISDVTIDHSTFYDNASWGMVMYTASSIADVSITRSGFDGPSDKGIWTYADLGTTDLILTCNWWGAADGPSDLGPGSGDSISETGAPFAPWLLTADLDGDCGAVALSHFRAVRRAANITAGADVCGTGHQAINLKGSAGAAGDTWITVYDTTPANGTVQDIFSSPTLSADVLIKPYNNKKGAGLLANFNEGVGQKGLALMVFNNGNTDTLVLGTVSKANGTFTALKSVSLSGKIAECKWYRVTFDVSVTGSTLTVSGSVQQHATASDPDSATTTTLGTLAFTGALPAGVDASGEVGIVGQATSAVLDSSVTNLVIVP